MLEIFDADCGCSGIAIGQKRPVSAENLLESMDRLEIQKAVVRYEPVGLSDNFARRNDSLFKLAEANGRIFPCPAAVPSSGLDVPKEDTQIDELITKGARFITIQPEPDCWLPEPFVCGKLFAAMEDRRLPLICPAGALPMKNLAQFAERYTKLPFIVAGLGYRASRNVNALLDSCKNVYVSLGHNYTIQGIVEQLTARYGGERFVLGTGFPLVDPSCAITQLSYAAVNEDEKRKIGHTNLERLMNEVEL